MNTRFYDLVKTVAAPVYKVFFPADLSGLENIPAEGGFILCANHLHWNDPIFLAAHMRKRRYHYLAKAEVFRKKLFAFILGEKGIGAIPIERGQADLNAVRKCMQIIKDGHALGIFPQGTRSRDNTPTPMLNGVSMIAMRAGAPIIPVYIDGPYRLFRRVDVRVGKPIDISDLGRKFDADTLSEVTKRIETAIWSMKN